MRPQVPARAKMTASMMTESACGWDGTSLQLRIPGEPQEAEDVLDRAERTFSATPRFFANRPVCRSHRSDAKERSRKTVVTQQPAMKRGFRPWAPMSEM